MKKTHSYRNIHPNDIYIGEVAYINEHTKYFDGNEQPKYYYTGYKPIRFIIFTLVDKTIKDTKSKEINAVRVLKDSYAFDLLTGRGDYPVYGKIDPDLVPDESIIVDKYHNIGELFKMVCDFKDDNREVTYDDALSFIRKLQTYNLGILDEKIEAADLAVTKQALTELKTFIEEVQKAQSSRKNNATPFKSDFNELALKLGL